MTGRRCLAVAPPSFLPSFIYFPSFPPAGRAAQRIGVMQGVVPSTLHRLLVYTRRAAAASSAASVGAGANADAAELSVAGSFEHGPRKPLHADAVLVDEAGMLSLPLAAALLGALRRGTQLVLVGDVDQLPPIGPGAVLQSLVDSGIAPVVDLREVSSAVKHLRQHPHQYQRSTAPSQRARQPARCTARHGASRGASPDGCAFLHAGGHPARCRHGERARCPSCSIGSAGPFPDRFLCALPSCPALPLQVFRQDAASGIVSGALSVRDGRPPALVLLASAAPEARAAAGGADALRLDASSPGALPAAVVAAVQALVASGIGTGAADLQASARHAACLRTVAAAPPPSPRVGNPPWRRRCPSTRRLDRPAYPALLSCRC